MSNDYRNKYDKFKLAEEGEEKNMSKKFEIEGREAWADIIAEVQEHEGKDLKSVLLYY